METGMEETLSVYKAVREDVPFIAEMAAKMWGNHTIENLCDEFNEIVDGNENAVFILVAGKQPAGFAQCQLRHDYVEGTDSCPVGYLEGIFVDQEHRRQGYAKALLVKCEEWARDKGCTEFASDCELDNRNSLAFHLKMGFSEANRIICFTKRL